MGPRAIVLALASLLAGAAPAAPPPDRPGAAGPANVVPLTMRTPRHGFNRLVVSLTVCAPGTGRCATIDDVMIDTGATGLRLEASAVPPWLDLPAFLGPDDRPLAECLHFVHDVAWGALHRTDLRVGGLVAAGLPIQVIGDARPRPPACPPSDVVPTSNGTLGLGPEPTDCRDPCEQDPDRPGVFVCEAGGCAPVRGRVAPAHRLPNPVSRLPGHDDGVVIALPPVPAAGAEAVTGTLTFGVEATRMGAAGAGAGTGTAAIVALGPTGRFTTFYGGVAYPESLIDSGTPTYVLVDPALPRCEGMGWAYCVAPEQGREAVMVGRDGARVSVPFRVGSFRAFLDGGLGASDGVALAGDPGSRAFVWGAPFFLGKRVSVVMEGRALPGAGGARGPLYAIEAFPPP